MIANRMAVLVLLCSMTPLLAQDGALMSHPVVPGAPYWATRMITVERTLPNGKKIRHFEARWEARDSRGWEWSRSPIQTKGVEYTEKEQLRGKLPMTYVLWNPQTQQRFEWSSNNKKMQVVSFDATDASSSDELRTRASVEDLLKSFKDPAQFTTKKIGTKMILDMPAEGMRAVRSVNGKFEGKFETRTQTVETWYAPGLEIPLSVVVNDSKAGIVGNAIIAIKRGEPDASLFRIPAGEKAKVITGKHTHTYMTAKADTGNQTTAVETASASAPVAAAAVPEPVVAVVHEPQVKPLVGFERPSANTEVASFATPVALPSNSFQTTSSSNRPAKVERVKVYKNAPAGWPAGLPPL